MDNHHFGDKQKFIKKKRKKKTLQPLTSVTGVTHRSLAFFLVNGRNSAKKGEKKIENEVATTEGVSR
jgi:hypothetical protein